MKLNEYKKLNMTKMITIISQTTKFKYQNFVSKYRTKIVEIEENQLQIHLD